MNWLQRLLCWLGIHRYQSGPGCYCEYCGQPDDLWQLRKRGVLARNVKTGVRVYLNSQYDLPPNYEWVGHPVEDQKPWLFP